MLNTNIFASTITDAQKAEFASAVSYSEFIMLIEVAQAQITGLKKKIESNKKPQKNGKYRFTEAEVQAFIDKIRSLEADIKEYEGKVAEFKPTYDKVMKAMVVGDNSKDNVVRLLRVIATANNSKLEKIALQSLNGDIELYNALEVCHDYTTSVTEDGAKTMTKKVKDNYKLASGTIQKILKVSLSLPTATEYTGEVRIKFDKNRVYMIQDAYVQGYANKFTKEEDGSVSYSGTVSRTLITKKTDKEGNDTYNWDKFNKVVCTLTVGVIAE